MGSIFYEFQPVHDGCILNIKDELLMPQSKKLAEIRQEILHAGELKSKEQTVKKQIEVKVNSPRKIIRNKSSTSELRKKLKDILRISRECGDNGSSPLKERQQFWDTMLNIGQWLNIGNDFKTSKEHEILMDKIGGCETVKLPMSKSKEYFTEGKNLSEISPLEGKNNASDKCNGKSVNENENRRYTYHDYISIDDIIPGAPRPGVLANEVDLQACNTAVEELSDKTTPFDTKSFLEFIVASCPESKGKHLMVMDAIGQDILDIKKNMTRTDWESIKDLYIEFKSKGVLEIHKVSDKILSMASKCYPRMMAHDWMITTGMAKRLTALKLGAFFLNVFHICYTVSAQEDENLVNLKYSSIAQSNKINEFRKLPFPMLNLYIKSQNRKNSEQNKRFISKTLTVKSTKRKTSAIQAKQKPINDRKKFLSDKPTTAKKKLTIKTK